MRRHGHRPRAAQHHGVVGQAGGVDVRQHLRRAAVGQRFAQVDQRHAAVVQRQGQRLCVARPGHVVQRAGEQHGAAAGLHLHGAARALLGQRQRAAGHRQPGARQQLRGQQRLGQRQRHLPVADAPQQRPGRHQRQPQPSIAFSRQHQRQSGVGHLLPQREVEFAALGGFARAFAHLFGEQAFNRIGNQVVVVHLRSKPRAMMPRRISRVPPRRLKLGVARVA